MLLRVLPLPPTNRNHHKKEDKRNGKSDVLFPMSGNSKGNGLYRLRCSLLSLGDSSAVEEDIKGYMLS